jgi:acyl carrier protein
MTDVENRIRAVLAATFGVAPATISDATSNETLAAWDSMNHLHLVVALEAEFGVSFEPEQAVELTSVRAIAQALGVAASAAGR